MFLMEFKIVWIEVGKPFYCSQLNKYNSKAALHVTNGLCMPIASIGAIMESYIVYSCWVMSRIVDFWIVWTELGKPFLCSQLNNYRRYMTPWWLQFKLLTWAIQLHRAIWSWRLYFMSCEQKNGFPTWVHTIRTH